MADKNSHPVKSPPGGFFNEIAMRVKLVLRLMGDRRVNVFLKLLPGLSLVYFFMPDLMIGPLDDAAVVGILFTLFIELCPQQVVDEHMNILRGQITQSATQSPNNPAVWPEDVIEGEYYDVTETSPHNNGRKEETEKR
jgi:uncharacterized membrane protein YkvA (DUF1232 family)